MKKRVKNKGKPVNKVKRVGKWLYWTPRVLSILFILFISMFSLDIFEMNLGFWGTILGLFMHLIPSFVLIIFLIISWKWEWVGAIGFFLFAIWYISWLFMNSLKNGFEWYYLAWSIQIALPALVIGILWWMNWKRKRR